jgi:Holliday junction resolvase RusA-like endonuclease
LGRGGNVYTPKESRAYERRARVLALQAGKLSREWPFATELPVALTLDIYFPNERRHDIDNVAKSVADAGNRVLWRDDSQIHELHVYRRIDAERPRVEVCVRILETAK